MHKTSPSFGSPVRSQFREQLPLVLIEIFALVAGVFAQPSARTLALLVVLLCVRHGLLASVATFRSMQARRAACVSVEVRLAERTETEQRDRAAPVGGLIGSPVVTHVEQKTSPYDCQGIAQAVEAVMAAKKSAESPADLTER